MDDRVAAIVKDYIKHCFDMIQENINKDCNDAKFTPSAIAISEPGGSDHVTFLPWNDDESKVMMLRELGSLCYKRKLLRLALMNDTVMKFYDKKPDEDTEFPLSYPPNMRDDCLIFLYIDFKDPNNNQFKAYKYKISKKKVVRGEVFDFNKDIQCMDSLIIRSISFGFIKTAMTDLFLKKELVPVRLDKEMGDMLLKEVFKEYPGAAAGMEFSLEKS